MTGDDWAVSGKRALMSHRCVMEQELYPGYFVPPRPSRNALEGYRMTPKFIEDRRSSVERFLNRWVSQQSSDQCSIYSK